MTCTLFGGFHKLPYVYCCQNVILIMCRFSAFTNCVGFVMVDDAISVPLVTSVNVHCPCQYCPHTENVDFISCCNWLAGYWFPFTALLPTQNAHTCMAAVWCYGTYGSSCSLQASCNQIWHCCAFFRSATCILIKQCYSYLINLFPKYLQEICYDW
jgi:hypothetical protein